MANIRHPNEPEYIRELIKTYSDAQAKLISIIGQKQARKTNTMYEKRILKQVNQVLLELNSDTKLWLNEHIPKEYKKSVNKLIRQYADMNIKIDDFDTFSKLHEEKIDLLIRNASNQMEVANSYIGRRTKDTVRQISIEATKQAEVTGRTVKQLRQELIDTFIDNKITTIKTKTGRNINIDSYAETVARSTTREAANVARIEHVTANGRNLVKMSSHATTCPICAPLQGRVYSIDGKDDRYPSLDVAFSGGYANIHPNCRHVILPYVKELDSNASRTREFSNRSFDIDPRSQTQIDNYNKIQKENAKRNSDKRQWERYKTVMPNDTPKTLSGFRRGKKANSDKYNNLVSEYRKIRSLKP